MGWRWDSTFSEVCCGELRYTKEAGLGNNPKGQLDRRLIDSIAERGLLP